MSTLDAIPAAHPSRPAPLPRLMPLLVAAAMAACGGGGGGPEAPNAPASLEDGVRVILAAPPTLPPGPTPSANGRYLCGNLSLGAAAAGEIEVPPGQVCVLQGTRVNGNLRLNPGSVLDARDVQLLGNLQADAAASVLLAGSSAIGGSVQIRQGGVASIVGTRITGDLQFDSQAGAVLAQGNQLGGSLQALGNRGGVLLNQNRVTGNLQCKDNQPEPRGSGNTAASAEDQCRNLAPPVPGGASAPVNPPAPPLPPAGSAPLPPSAAAPGSNVSCLGQSLGAQTFANVGVPAGARCELNGTRLTGNLELAPGASVISRDAQIAGSLLADGPGAVQLSGGRITGGVQIERGQSVTLAGAGIGGSVQLVALGGLLWLQGLQVGGDVQLFDNRGGATLNLNQVGGNLQCKGNTPAPSGADNRAAAKQDQCAGL